MNFKTNIEIDPASFSVSYQDFILSIGSCFAENIAKKMQNLLKAAEQYLYKYKLDCEVRFDIVAISNFPKRPDIMHFEDAFYSYN